MGALVHHSLPVFAGFLSLASQSFESFSHGLVRKVPYWLPCLIMSRSLQPEVAFHWGLASRICFL